MNRTTITVAMAGLAGLMAAAPAVRADPTDAKPAPMTEIGVYGGVGAAGGNFTQPDAVGATSAGMLWHARLGVGSRSILGAEAAYVGGVRDVSALGLASSAVMVNNGVEAVARLNVPITRVESIGALENILVEPYTFGGVGWQHYNVTSSTADTADLSDADDIMTVPLGVGLQFGLAGFSIDARGTYRHSLYSDLLGSSTSSFDSKALNGWDVGLSIGFEL